MIKLRRQAPYNKEGTTNFRYTSKRPGVYIIYKKDKPVYIGMSGYDLYKTMYRHFQDWSSSTQARTTYKYLKDITCRVILCTPKQAERLERLLIIKHKPKDNPMKYLKYNPTPADSKMIRDFVGAPVESCPF